MADFTIAGAGIAGLVLARRLARGGRSVILREASDHLGGTVGHHRVGGLDLDSGAESFAVYGGVVAALAEELGLETEAPATGGAWLQPPTGVARPLPATGVFGIPGHPLAADVRAVLGLAGSLRAALDVVLPPSALAADATIGALVRRRMGRAALERLVAPVVHGVYSLDPTELPVDTAVPALRGALEREGSLAAAVRSLRAAAPAGSAVAGIRGGMHQLVVALTRELVHLGVDVRLGDRADLAAAGLIVAAPLSAEGRRVTLATLVVEVPELDSAPRGTGVLVATGVSGVRARALTHSTAKWAWLREIAGERHVLRLSYDDGGLPNSDLPHGELREVARADAEALLGVPIAPETVLDFETVNWIRPQPAPAPPGVTVIGESVAGSGLARIIAHADRVAEELLAD